MANTLNLGDGNWATKEDSLLAYNSENNNYKPLPFDFSRAGSATRVNKDGLIELVGSGQARIDFKDDSKGALLLEPSRTNLILTSASGTYGNQPASETNTISPDGTNNAVIPTPDGNSDRYEYSISSGAYATDTKLTYSWYRKRISTPINTSYIGDLQIKVLINATQVGSTTQIQSDVNGFDRFQAVLKIIDGSSSTTIRAYFGHIIGNGNSSIAYWGHQLEQGSYPTSYIPTQGGTVTRLAESCVGAGNEQVFNDSEGTFFVNFAADFNIYNSGLTDRGISISDGTNTNSARIFQATSLNNRMAYDLDTSSGTNQVFNTSTTFADITDFNKVAFTYKENEFKIFLNGVQQGSTDTNGSVFSNGTLNGISFNYGQEGNKPFFGRVKEVKYFNTALTNEELEALTTI